jgi:hypothetical protein
MVYQEKQKGSYCDIPLAYNYMVGLMYICIMITGALGVALVAQWYLLQQGIVEYAPKNSHLPAPQAVEISFGVQLFSTIVTITVSALSILIFITLPLIIGSIGNHFLHFVLKILRLDTSWRALFIAKSTLVIAVFTILALVVTTTNIREGYAILISGAVTTLFATIILILQLIIKPSQRKNLAKAW